MHILIPGLVKNSQLKRLAQEGEKKGHTVEGCYASDLTIYADGGTFEPRVEGKDLASYDLVYLMVSKRRWEWYQAASFLHKKGHTIIVNQKIVDPTYEYFLTPAADYLKQVENNLPFPKTSIVFSKKAALAEVSKFNFPLIVKISGGRQGKGVFKVESEEDLVNIVDENQNMAPFALREFIPNDGDIRVFTVGYKALGAMKRTPIAEGEFRSNISQGGRGEEFDLEASPEIAKIAESLSELTKTEIAGVDIMINKENGKPYILEINPGPQFAGFEKYTSINAAETIIKYFESLQQKSQSA